MSVVGLLFDSWRVTGIELFGINIGVTFIDKLLVLSLQPVQNIAGQHAMGLSRLYTFGCVKDNFVYFPTSRPCSQEHGSKICFSYINFDIDVNKLVFFMIA